MRAATNLYSTLNDAIQLAQGNLESSINQLSSGKRVSSPADDPSAFAQNVQILSVSANVDRYTKNAEAATSQAQLADSALSAVVSSLTSAIGLTTQGGSPTLSQTQREELGKQVQGILQTVVAQANTTFGGVALFAGTSGNNQAFVPDPNNPEAYVYTGNSEANETAVGETLSVPLNVPGNQIFTAPGADVLSALQDSSAALISGDATDLSDANASLTAAIAHVDSMRAIYGGTVNQLTTQSAYLSQEDGEPFSTAALSRERGRRILCNSTDAGSNSSRCASGRGCENPTAIVAELSALEQHSGLKFCLLQPIY